MSQTDDSSESNLSDAEKIQSAVETANAEDEKDTGANDQADDEELDEGDEEESNDSDESEDDKSDDDDSSDDEKDDESSERKFKNLAAEDDKGYISNLEKAYEASSAEAVRLNTELGTTQRRVDALMQAVSSDPDLAERLNKAMGGTDDKQAPDSPTDNPFLVDAQTKWREKSAKEVQDIVDANPELLSDPKINEDVRRWMEVLSAEEFKLNKRLMSGGEAMEKAMRLLGLEDKRNKKSVNSAAKDMAAASKPNSSKKSKLSTKVASDAAYKFGALMGVSKEKIDKYAS